MEKEISKYLRRREEMVKRQIEARGVSDPRVLDAMRRVPRHLFVSEALEDQAYGDFPLPIGDGQTISQPYIVAEMTQALKVGEKDRVLEIGTGSGYQAAVLAQIVYRVYTIERIHALYIKTRRLFDQLTPGGRLVIPVGDQYIQDLVRIEKDERGVHQTSLGGCRFVKLVGEYGWKKE